MKLEPIILSLLDTDLYKFNMDQVIFHKHTDLSGEYYFRCRNEGVVFTREMYREINAQIDHLCKLTFKKEELDYLRSIRFIKDDYVEFLRLWHPIRDYVKVELSRKGELSICVHGPLFSAMQFEIYLLEIVNEVYFRMKYDYATLRASAEERLNQKIADFNSGKCRGLFHGGRSHGLDSRLQRGLLLQGTLTVLSVIGRHDGIVLAAGHDKEQGREEGEYGSIQLHPPRTWQLRVRS